MERLVVYGYRPWRAHGPRSRKTAANKRALVIASAAAPASANRLLCSAMKQRKATACMIGANSSDLIIGLVESKAHTRLSMTNANRIERATARLLQAPACKTPADTGGAVRVRSRSNTFVLLRSDPHAQLVLSGLPEAGHNRTHQSIRSGQ
jgi:hypothetical protein